MAIYKNSDRRIWCDICKITYPQYQDKETKKMTWPLRAQTVAVWITVSEVRSKGFRRAYCQSCANDYQRWTDNSLWTFKEMQAYAKGMRTLDGVES